MRMMTARPASRRLALWAAMAVLLVSLIPAPVRAQSAQHPAAQSGDGWLASYWNNATLSGTPVLARVEPDVNFRWGVGSPAPEIDADLFSARWTRTVQIPAAGLYCFSLNSDDGARLWIDGNLVIDAWYDHGPARTFSATRLLDPGSHELRIEYYERRGAAVVRFDWQLTGTAPSNPTPTPLPPPLPNPSPANLWRGEYFNNRDLIGSPSLVRSDAAVEFNWGTGSPAAGIIGADNFSVRWTSTQNLPSGVYRLRATVDDGVRVFVNDRLVIDGWRVQAATTLESDDIALGAGVPIRVEYFEATGEARVALSWRLTSSVPQPPLPPPASEFWTAEYFNNANLGGSPVLVRAEGGSIDYNWATASPAPGVVAADFFSARWSRAVTLAGGVYRFRVVVDDAARLFVNNALILDQWRQQGVTEFTADIALPAGAIPIRLEYADFAGDAVIRLSWQLVSGGGGGGGGGTTPEPSWSRVRPRQPYIGEYFANRDLSGAPALVRQDGDIDFDWGNGSPGPGVPADQFSVRWSNTLRLDKGRYRFSAETDDGVRLYINDRLVIDKWQTQSRRQHSYETSLDGGDYTIRMEYFDAGGEAVARLRVEARKESALPVGNIITCVPPQPQNYAWIKLYRLDGNNQWYSLGPGIGSINASGFLKIDGLPVDENRFGGVGEPYRVEQWIDGKVARSTGDFQRGEPIFRVRAFADNVTPWSCSP